MGTPPILLIIDIVCLIFGFAAILYAVIKHKEANDTLKSSDDFEKRCVRIMDDSDRKIVLLKDQVAVRNSEISLLKSMLEKSNERLDATKAIIAMLEKRPLPRKRDEKGKYIKA